MRTFIIGMLLLVFSISQANAQYKFIKNYNDDVFTIIPCKDSTFYTVSIHPGCGINSYNVRYINRHGDVINSFESPLNVAHFDLFEGVTDNQNRLTLLYHSAGYNTVMQMDTAGNQVFCRTFNPNGYKFNRIIPAGNGYYLCGNKNLVTPSDSGRATIVKVNSVGNFEWAKVYRMPGWKDLFFEDCLERNDSLLVGGYYSNGQSPQLSYPYLAMMDTMGNLANEFTYVIDSMMSIFEPFKITKLDFYDENIIFAKHRASAGVDRLMQLNGNLDPQWTKNISGDLEMICASYDGTVFFNTGICFNSALVKMSSTGSVSGYTANTLSGSEGVAGTNMMYRWDCGYLLGTPVGWPADLYSHIPPDAAFCDGIDSSMTVNVYSTYTVTKREVNALSSSTSFSQFSGALVFTPTLITMITFCEEAYSCQGTLDLNEEANKSSILVYPNPSNGQFTLSASDEIQSIQIYNNLGQMLYHSFPLLEQIDVDLSNHPTGTYWLRIQTRNKTYTQQIVIQ